MPPSYRWVILLVCVLSFMQVHTQRMVFAALIPTFVADLGISYAAAGAIQTAYFWTYTIVQMPVGVLTDRWGSRGVMAIFMATLAAGVGIFSLSGSFVTSVLGRAIVGLGAAAVWVPGMRLIMEWFPSRERGRVTGIFSAGGGIGGTLALLVIPWLAERWGWRLAYAITAVPVIVALGLIAWLVRSRVGATDPTAPPRSGALRSVLTSPVIWPYNMAVLFSYGGYFSLLTFLPAFFVRALGVTPSEAGALTSLITAGTIVSWPAAGMLSDWLGRRKVVYLFSQAASVIVCLVFAQLVPRLEFASVAAVSILTGIVVGGMVTPYVMVVELFPRELAGTAASVANTSCFVGGMILPVILGLIADVTGRFADAFLVAAGVQVLALVFGLFIREPTIERAAVVA